MQSNFNIWGYYMFSIPDLINSFSSVDDEVLATIVIASNMQDAELVENFDSAYNAVKECYHKPSHSYLLLRVFNNLLHGYGIEYISSIEDTHSKLYGLSYVNLGDLYNTTIVYNHNEDEFLIANCGSIIEKLPNYYI